MWFVIGIIIFIIIAVAIWKSIDVDGTALNSPQEDKTDWWTVGAVIDILNKQNKK